MKLKLKTAREDRQKIIILLVSFSGVGLAALQSDTRNSTPFLAVVDRRLFGSVSTRLIETVEYEKETMKSIIWLAFWNLGLIALSICVLAGCRTTAEKNYALAQWPRSTIGLIWGEECEEATADIIPDWYKFGASGVCRVTEDGTSCKRKFPPTFNLAQAVLQDLDKAKSSSKLEKCKEAIDKPIDHKTPKTLGAILVAFLITSIFINLFSVAIAAAEGHGWALWTSSILAVDMLLIFGSLILTVAMMNYEGGGYLVGVHGQEFSDKEMMGIALWMLLAMLIGRLFSNPWLIVLFVLILVTIIVVSLVLIRTRGFFYVVRTVVV